MTLDTEEIPDSKKPVFIKCSRCSKKLMINIYENLHNQEYNFSCDCEFGNYTFSHEIDKSCDPPETVSICIDNESKGFVLKVGKHKPRELYNIFHILGHEFYLKTKRKEEIQHEELIIPDIIKVIMISILLTSITLYLSYRLTPVSVREKIIEHSNSDNICPYKHQEICYELLFSTYCESNTIQCSEDDQCLENESCDTNCCLCRKKCETSNDCVKFEEEKYCSNNMCVNVSTYVQDSLHKRISEEKEKTLKRIEDLHQDNYNLFILCIISICTSLTIRYIILSL